MRRREITFLIGCFLPFLAVIAVTNSGLAGLLVAGGVGLAIRRKRQKDSAAEYRRKTYGF